MRQTMGFSEPDRIVVRGKDLCAELIGQVDFASMLFLELTGRLPSQGEATMVNAVLVTLTEHGITPNSLATRLTYLASPSSLQGAVAAGILGAGEVFLGAIEQCAQLLQRLAIEDAADRTAAVTAYVDDAATSGVKVPGIGHPVHKPEDPRTARLFDLADHHIGQSTHRELLQQVQAAAESRYSRVLPINADGAIAAVLSDMGFDWSVCRGFAVVARAAGLVGHVNDEARHPVAKGVWDLAERAIAYEDPEIEAAVGAGRGASRD